MPKDQGTVAMRHCLESGRSDMECLGEGMKVGLTDLSGGAIDLSTTAPSGLRLTGLYMAGNFGLRFMQDHVAVGCGTLAEQDLPYSVERSGSRIQVHIAIAPKPLSLSYEADGHLQGPGPIDVAGLVPGKPVGSTSTSYDSQTQTTTTQRSIDTGDVANYSADQVHQNGMEFSVDQQTTTTSMVPTHTTHYTVPMIPKTEHCDVAALPPAGKNISVSGVLTQFVGSNASKSSNLAPGLRLNGTYAASGGLKIEFRDDSATLDCSGALSSEAYVVAAEGGQLVVKFQHNGGPLSLVLQQNGTLSGSGNVDVAGRKIYQDANGHVAYTPHNARCSVGMLAISQ